MSWVFQILCYICLTVLFFAWFIWKRKNELEHMYLMMSSMAIGMMIGLIAGLIFGANYQGDLYVSTLWAMLVGGGFGLIFGIPLSPLCSIEGMLTGVMSGMMGAMLGEMIPGEKVLPILFVFVLVHTACIMLFVKFIHPTSKDVRSVISIHNPIIPAVILIGIFVWFQTLSLSQEITHSRESTVKKLYVDVLDNYYKPNEVLVNKGEKVQITLRNKGNVEHDLHIVSKNGAIIKIDQQFKDHDHGDQTDETIHLHVIPGETNSVLVEARTTGNYLFYCTIPGHKESGMIGKFIVM